MKEKVLHNYNEYVQLMADTGLLIKASECDAEIKGLIYDSTIAEEGSLFICKGAAFKEEYLKSAISKGACAYISEIEYPAGAGVPSIIVRDIRKAMSHLANFYYCMPQDQLKLIGITGTKGKSTTAYYIKAILDDYIEENGGHESGIISSIDVIDGVIKKESHITTPEAVELEMHFRNAVDSGIEFMEMEVSSQALKYDRVSEILFDVGVFLNISEDHISPIEHSDMEDYFSSKLRIFEKTRTAVVNLDSDMADRIMAGAKTCQRVITISCRGDADVKASNIRKDGDETAFLVETKDFTQEFRLTMPGLFNVENAVAAIAIAMSLNIPLKYMLSGLYKARSSGRMELFTSADNKIAAIVDYAHNKLSFDALFKSTMEEYKGYKIVTIFGCPGKKAFLRRRDLGTIAGKFSNKVILCAEDPGPEPVEDISKDIAKYVEAENCPYEMIEDRGEAIHKAIRDVKDKTVLLITGKGNETRQKYGCEYIDCPSDVEYVKMYIKEYDESCK